VQLTLRWLWLALWSDRFDRFDALCPGRFFTIANDL
jgi:hypothetical protein